jgi:4-alpha-glucanotransferase
MFERSSGILLHISSLSGKDGIGTFGKEAYEFVDFLKRSHQKLWQILPLGTTSYGDSPYQSFSAFAGTPYFIDMEELVNRGGLNREDIDNADLIGHKEYIDYEKIYNNKLALLKKAYFNEAHNFADEIKIFVEKNSYWVEGYALFMAIKDKNNGLEWTKWEKKEKFAYIKTLRSLKEELKDEINYYIYLQYLFYTQWEKLKKYANDNGIKIIGDLPIFISGDSADAWLKTELFLFDENKNMKVVAGCPPDVFSKDGQLWGNPLYNWKINRRRKYSWWIERMKSAFSMYDIVRIDHFRGFESYWEIPGNAKTARYGRWVKGPGMNLFKAIKSELGDLPIIAEDLGFLTKEVEKLLHDSEYPGMKILEFGFGGGNENGYLPHNYPENSVAYTGTHDNETVVGWNHNIDHWQREHARNYLRDYLGWGEVTDNNIHMAMVEGVMKSKAIFAIIPMQDFLGLDNRARINTPSTLGDNWKWRLKGDELKDDLANYIGDITKRYNRF